MTEYEFYAKTSEGWVIKSISDILKMCLKINGKFVVDENGIHNRQPDEEQHIMTEIELNRSDFEEFEFNLKEPRFFGLKLSEFQKHLKDIKKKDTIIMYIEKGDPLRLKMKFRNNDDVEDEAEMNIFKIPKKIEQPIECYTHPMIISTSDFQKMIKKFSSFSDKKIVVEIQGSNYSSFFVDGNLISNSKKKFGTLKEDEDMFTCEVYVSDLKRLVKLTSLSKNMKIYAPIEKYYPIKFETKAANLGSAACYLKSVEFIENDSQKRN